MIRVRFFTNGVLFLAFLDEAGMARAYADWAQLQGYGIEMETLE